MNKSRSKCKCLFMLALLAAMMIIMGAFGLVGCGNESASDDAAAEQASEPEATVAAEDSGAGGALAEGDAAPEFTAELSGGGTFEMAENHGEVILLNFWATWCGPCREEMPAFEKLYAEYGDKVQILAVDLSETREEVDQFIADSGYTFPIAYDETGEIGSLYPTDGIPYTLVIGRDGTIKNIYLGAEGADAQYAKYKSAIEEALNE